MHARSKLPNSEFSSDASATLNPETVSLYVRHLISYYRTHELGKLPENRWLRIIGARYLDDNRTTLFAHVQLVNIHHFDTW